MPPSTAAITQIQEAVARIRKVLEKENDPAVFDEEAPRHTNRGNKLKRKAEAYGEGRLGGQRLYKKRIDYAGYDRYMLHKNPKRYDEDGYELDAEDEDPQADEEVANKNPYNQVIIQDLLMPLTAASELENHPTMSLPYKSKILPNMVQQACSMLHKERRTLVELKRLLTRFRGDHPWIPCGDIFTENDKDLFSIDILPEHVDRIIVQKPNGKHNTSPSNVEKKLDTVSGSTPNQQDTRPQESSTISEIDHDAMQTDPNPPQREQTAEEDAMATDTNQNDKDSDVSKPNTAPALSNTTSTIDHQPPPPSPKPEVDNQNPPPTSPLSHPRMLTRQRAQVLSAPSAPPSPPPQQPLPSSPSTTTLSLPIHPLFTLPPTALPDRNFNLPDPEAEETRRSLTALVQKQEEVTRGVAQLYEGLLKAERMMRLVWRWCRAEGHIGEMSDGEDWVDLEEWGLEGQQLKKGMEEGVADGSAAVGGGGEGEGHADGAGKEAGDRRVRARRGAQ